MYETGSNTTNASLNQAVGPVQPSGSLEKTSLLGTKISEGQSLLVALHDTISRAERELSKVLSPCAPETCKEGNPRPTLSPLVMQAQDVNDMISSAISRLNVLLNRSEA